MDQPYYRFSLVDSSSCWFSLCAETMAHREERANHSHGLLFLPWCRCYRFWTKANEARPTRWSRGWGSTQPDRRGRGGGVGYAATQATTLTQWQTNMIIHLIHRVPWFRSCNLDYVFFLSSTCVWNYNSPHNLWQFHSNQATNTTLSFILGTNTAGSIHYRLW